MDILHLSRSELDYELHLRHETEFDNKNRREKTGKLRSLIKRERSNLEVPTSADHVMEQAEHLALCNNMLIVLKERFKDALEDENVTELAICNSKFLHYRQRLALITDKKHTSIAQRLERTIEESLKLIDNYFKNVTLLDKPIHDSRSTSSGDDSLVPDELLEQLKRGSIHSSPKHGQNQAGAGGQDGDHHPANDLHFPTSNAPGTTGGRRPTALGATGRGGTIAPGATGRGGTTVPGTTGGDGGNAPVEDIRDEIIRLMLRRQQLPQQPAAQNNPQRYRCMQPIHKWPFTYAGERNVLQLAMFLKRVKTFADTEDMDELLLVRGVKHLLKDRALEWYTRNYTGFANWEVFKREIKAEFLPPNHSQLIKKDMYWRYQGQEETFSKYSHDMLALFELVEPEMSQEERFFILKSNLNSEFSAIASASRTTTVAELTVVCKDYDNAKLFSQKNKTAVVPRSALMEPSLATPFINRTPKPINPGYSWNRAPAERPQQVNIIDENCLSVLPQTATSGQAGQVAAISSQTQELQNTSQELMQQEVNAISTKNRYIPRGSTSGSNGADEQRVTTKCWQCEQTGHTFPSCDQPKTFLFCFRCGKKDTTSRNCQGCIARLSQALPESTIRQ